MSGSPISPSRVAAFFDREAVAWDAAHGPQSGRAGAFAARARYLRALCAEKGVPRVLDLGCGTGHQLIDLTDHIEGGVGLDLSPEMISRARENAAAVGADTKVTFQVGDSAAAPIDLGRFGLAIFVGSLEHAPDQAAQLAAAAKLLEQDGRLVVIMPHPHNPSVLWARCFGPSFDVPLRHRSPRALAAVARAAGLRLESVQALPYGGSVVIPAGIARRWPLMAGAYAARFALA